MGSLDGIISLGSWGGQGGDHWIYIASREITEIIIHESVNIKSISFKEAGGFISGTFGGRNPNDRGEEKKVEIHWPSEYLKSISGTSGDYNGLVVIRSLSFITNLTTYGPFGTTDGCVPFSIPVANSVVVGFHGRSGYYLDALGIFVQPVQPHGSIPLGLWGGPGRNPFSFRTKIDGHLEYLRSITGAYGNSPTDNSFSIPVEGSAVIGFHGRGGYYLDAIGIHVKPREIEEAISIGPWGGDGGNQWSYKTNRGISQIVIYVGLNIKSISFQDTTDLDSGTFGGNNSNDLGERKTVHINWPSEHLTSISGMYGNYASLTTITSLSFTTNRATYGPFGSALGTSFSIPINNNTVVGFHGRAGHYLDAIGIFVKPYAAS